MMWSNLILNIIVAIFLITLLLAYIGRALYRIFIIISKIILKIISILLKIFFKLIYFILKLIIASFPKTLLGIKYELAISNFLFYIWSILLWLNYNPSTLGFYELMTLKINNIDIVFAVDGLSIFFIYLTTFLVSLCFFFLWDKPISRELVNYLKSLICLEILLILIFLVLDLFCFYILFEMILLPFFIFIGISAYKKRKIHAAYMLFFYTLTGSLFLLPAIFIIYLHTGTTNLLNLMTLSFSNERAVLIWICFFLAFAVKIPIFPFHVWLPEAHVEASTEGSVLLAGILLKLGTYGFLRFLIPLFPETTYYFQPIIFLLSGMGVIYSSLTTLRQIDIKRIIAYSSIAHMNLCMLGLSTVDIYAIKGSILIMVGHGITSAGLFFIVGSLYNRFKTKLIFYYSGIIYGMPMLSFFFFLFFLGNISMPGTSNFLGEFLILIGLIENKYYYVVVFIVISIFLGTVYNLWLFNKINFGTLDKKNIYKFHDLTYNEIIVYSFLTFHMLWVGLYPIEFFSLLDKFFCI